MMVQLKNYWQKTFSGTKPWIVTIGCIFVVSIIVGFCYYFFNPTLLQFIANYFRNILQNSPGTGIRLAIAIFTQNTISSVFALFGGVLLGVIPVGIIVFNGLIIGYVISAIIHTLQVSAAIKVIVLVATLVPHGIFEIPAVVCSAALGLKLGLQWVFPKAQGQRFNILKHNLLSAVRFLPFLVIVLAIAALIEVFVSGAFAQSFLH